MRRTKLGFKMGKIIICLSGFSGSGKSTIARLLRKIYLLKSLKIGKALELNASKENMTFNEYLNKIKNSTNAPSITEIKQQIERLLEKSNGLVIEGINKKAEIEMLQKLFPQTNVITCFVDAPLNVRINRVSIRKRIPLNKAREYVLQREIDRQKQGMLSIKRNSDFVIDTNSLNLNQIISLFKSKLKISLIKKTTDFRKKPTRSNHTRRLILKRRKLK